MSTRGRQSDEKTSLFNDPMNKYCLQLVTFTENIYFQTIVLQKYNFSD